MKMHNLLLVFFVIILLLTLVSIVPFQSGHFIAPSPISLEASLFLILMSVIAIAFIILRKKGLTPLFRE